VAACGGGAAGGKLPTDVEVAGRRQDEL